MGVFPASLCAVPAEARKVRSEALIMEAEDTCGLKFVCLFLLLRAGVGKEETEN